MDERFFRSREAIETHIEHVLKTHKPKSYTHGATALQEAAVLIPIYVKEGETHVLFTRRTEIVEHHKGQISFPGGKQDASDHDLQHTALRETYEEVGIAPQDIRILGRTDYFLTNTLYMVSPFVGVFDYPYEFRVNRDEIASLIEVPLRHLLQDEIFEVKPYTKDNQKWWVHYYYYKNETIWGVTGFLLSNFLSLIFGLQRNHHNAI